MNIYSTNGNIVAAIKPIIVIVAAILIPVFLALGFIITNNSLQIIDLFSRGGGVDKYYKIIIIYKLLMFPVSKT